MYEIGLNVRISLNVHQSESCTLRLIPYIEADRPQCTVQRFGLNV